MSITVNTNMQALKIQDNLSKSTNAMNTAMERMSSGSKINSASDDAAGLAVSTKLSTTLSSSKVASDNVSIGNDMLSTAEGNMDVILKNLQRVRDLTEQASNGTYSTADLKAIQDEVSARMVEITTIASSATFNGKTLFSGSTGGITLQVGTTSADTLNLASAIFDKVQASAIGAGNDLSNLASIIGASASTTSDISAYLTTLDNAIAAITTRETQIGAAQNQLSAVADGLDVQQTNLTSALSTVKDADVAEESASYVQQQILQSASASLLVQANSAPQIALTLIKG